MGKERRKGTGSSEQQSPPEPPEGGCHFYIQRKNRYCRFHPAVGANYCAEHASSLNVPTDKRRIPCPYDPKHSCYESKLAHHLKRCPRRPRDMPAYHTLGINSGEDAGEEVPDPKVTVLTVPVEEVQSMIDTVNSLYAEHVGLVEEEILSHSCLQAELDNTTYGTAAMRHRKQQASLIGHMEKLGLLRDDVCYLEMGAGKGQLSHWLHGAVEKYGNVGFLLIDRSAVRYKFDNLHKEEESGPKMERLRMDIEHLNLGNVPCLQNRDKEVVGYGKHLCGGATDLALRCMIETLSDCESTDSGETDSKRPKTVNRGLKGTVIALCCHHRCTWKAYVGKKFFKTCGLTARDFQLMSSMSSWGTCTWKGWSHTRKSALRVNKDVDESVSALSGSEGKVSNDVKDTVEKSHRVSPKPVETDGDLPEDSDEQQGEDRSGDLGEELLKESDVDRIKKDIDGSREVLSVAPADEEDSDEDVEHQQRDAVMHSSTGAIAKLTETQREEVGRKCKRLIDIGRVKYLEEHGLASCLKTYIEEYFTPENVLLLGHRV